MNFKKMNFSIKKRIYCSFSLLVLLFVINGIASNITLNHNRKLAENISAVVDPSLQGLSDFQAMLVESKMYTTNWVFLRSNQDDKNALIKLHNTDYPALKARLTVLSSALHDQAIVGDMNHIYAGFERLLVIERTIMGLLQKFEDYDDPVAKLEAERIIEDELLPR